MTQDVWTIYFILVIALFAPLLSSPHVISRSKNTKIKSDQIHCLMYLSSKVHRSSVHVRHCLFTGIAIQNEKKIVKNIPATLKIENGLFQSIRMENGFGIYGLIKLCSCVSSFWFYKLVREMCLWCM